MTLSEFVVDRAREWYEAGRPVVVATITSIRGSSSQPLGSRMVVTDGGEFAGFVSGGCVETDVYEKAQQVLEDGTPRRLHYRQVKDSIFEIGLNCDGRIDVVVEPLTDALLSILAGESHGLKVTRYRDLEGGTVEVEHLEFDDQPASASGVPEPVVHSAREVGESRTPASLTGTDGWNYLLEPGNFSPTLMIVSANSVAYPLSKLAKALGYRVVVSDPRADYLSAQRFPDADLLLPVWPRELPQHVKFGADCVVVSLNHEPRFEDDLFRTLQAQPRVSYLGALGKRKRHDERIARQAESGFDLDKLPPIHTPIGLDIGGRSAEEVALAILAEVQAERHGRTGGLLMHQQPGRKDIREVKA